MQRSVIYKALRDRAKEKLTWVQYIDLQKGQFNHPADNYPIPLPALLFEFAHLETSNQLSTLQTTELIIRISLCLQCVTDSFDTSITEIETIELLDKWDEIFNTYHGFYCENITRLTRIRELPADYNNGLIILASEYSTVVKESVDKATVRIAKPTITIEKL